MLPAVHAHLPRQGCVAFIQIVHQSGERLLGEHLQIAEVPPLNKFAILHVQSLCRHSCTVQHRDQLPREEHCVSVGLDNPVVVGSRQSSVGFAHDSYAGFMTISSKPCAARTFPGSATRRVTIEVVAAVPTTARSPAAPIASALPTRPCVS